MKVNTKFHSLKSLESFPDVKVDVEVNYKLSCSNIKFQNSEFQEDASPLSKQMKYAFPKSLAAA